MWSRSTLSNIVINNLTPRLDCVPVSESSHIHMSNLEYVGSDSARNTQNGMVVVGEWNNRRRNWPRGSPKHAHRQMDVLDADIRASHTHTDGCTFSISERMGSTQHIFRFSCIWAVLKFGQKMLTKIYLQGKELGFIHKKKVTLLPCQLWQEGR